MVELIQRLPMKNNSKKKNRPLNYIVHHRNQNNDSLEKQTYLQQVHDIEQSWGTTLQSDQPHPVTSQQLQMTNRSETEEYYFTTPK